MLSLTHLVVMGPPYWQHCRIILLASV